MCKCGTEGCGLMLDLVVLDKQLDLMVVKVFSNLKNSVILYIMTADAPVFLQGVCVLYCHCYEEECVCREILANYLNSQISFCFNSIPPIMN